MTEQGIDKASAFRDYLSRYGGTQEDLAGRLGIDRSTVSNLIRGLAELAADVAGGEASAAPGATRAIARSRHPFGGIGLDFDRREPVSGRG